MCRPCRSSSRPARPVYAVVLLLLLGSLGGPEATAQSVSMTFTPSRDNTLFGPFQLAAGPGKIGQSGTLALSNGAGESLFVGMTLSNGARRGLIAFDVSSIPAGSTVTQVDLTMTMDMGVGGSQSIALHEVLADWGEGASNSGFPGGGGAPAQPGDATWLDRFFGLVGATWASPGGDFDPSVSAQTPVDASGTYSWSSTAALVADVQSWVDAPASNYGWILIGNEALTMTAKRFASRERSVAAQVPMLTVQFTPAPGPAPAAIPTLSFWGVSLLSLLMLGAGWWALRRSAI